MVKNIVKRCACCFRSSYWSHGFKSCRRQGRESFGADPYLQGVGGAATVEGMQDEGVIATARHLIGNEQEHFRQVGEWDQNGWDKLECSLSSNIGDRAMHEVYLWPFANVVRAGVGSVMCAYNRVNNTYACENSNLLNNLLKSELSFQGFVVSDWGAQHSGVNSVISGLDMSMPGEVFDDWLTGKSYWGPLLTRAVYNGTISQARLDDMAMRILAPFLLLKVFNYLLKMMYPISVHGLIIHMDKNSLSTLWSNCSKTGILKQDQNLVITLL